MIEQFKLYKLGLITGIASGYAAMALAVTFLEKPIYSVHFGIGIAVMVFCLLKLRRIMQNKIYEELREIDKLKNEK